MTIPAEAGPVILDLTRRPSLIFLILVTILVGGPTIVNPPVWPLSLGGFAILGAIFVLGPRVRRRIGPDPLALCENGFVLAEGRDLVVVPWREVTSIAISNHRHVFFEVHCGRTVILSPATLGPRCEQALRIFIDRCDLKKMPDSHPARLVRRDLIASRAPVTLP